MMIVVSGSLAFTNLMMSALTNGAVVWAARTAELATNHAAMPIVIAVLFLRTPIILANIDASPSSKIEVSTEWLAPTRVGQRSANRSCTLGDISLTGQRPFQSARRTRRTPSLRAGLR